MRVHPFPSTRAARILALVFIAGACHDGAPKPRSEGLARQLREVALTAERDSLLMEVVANGKLLSDIQAELSTVQPTPAPGTVESPTLEVTRDQRTFTLERIKDITTRLKGAETRLAASERRALKLTQSVDSLAGENAAAKATITDLVAVLGSQRATIEGLTAQVEGLTVHNLVLTDSVYRLTDRQNTAFYVVGTRAELLRKGVLVEDGPRAIPFIGRRRVQPARELPLAEFTSIDRSVIREIPLPKPDKSYRIVSRQNLEHLAARVGSMERLTGTIAIASPEEFWEPSKYLIVVEK
jgi:hypothetical protein